MALIQLSEILQFTQGCFHYKIQVFPITFPLNHSNEIADCSNQGLADYSEDWSPGVKLTAILASQ